MMADEDGSGSDPKGFYSKPVWARILVIAAGPVFNFILAFIFAIVIVHMGGFDYPSITGVVEGYPAAAAGLMEGDRIVGINGRQVSASRDVQTYMLTHPGREVVVTWERQTPDGAKRMRAQLQPVYSEESGRWLTGAQFSRGQQVDSVWELLRCSVYEVKYCITSTFDSFGMLFRRQVEVGEAVAGPVRIVTMMGETVETGREAGTAAFFYTISYWFLLLSASLGIMNLLPIPALDGGRLIFMLFELVRGKPIDREKEAMVHMAGMMLLMALMVMILFNDIRHLL